MNAGTQVKICGVNSPAAFDAVVEGAADYLGFVFFERSPRCVTPAQAASLSARHAGGPKRVGLFVGPEAEDVQAVLDRLQLDILQLYGSAALCRDIQARFALPAWRAIGVAAPAELPGDAQGLAGFVIEAKAPAGATPPRRQRHGVGLGFAGGLESPRLLASGRRPAAG